MRATAAPMPARATVVAVLLSWVAAACSLGGGGVRPGAAAATTTTGPSTTTGQPPAEAPGAYGFSFQQEVRAGGEQWTLDAAGRVVGGGLTCRVRASGPGVAIDRYLIRVGDALWARDGTGGEFLAVDPAGDEVRALLAFCPRWAPDPGAAGLAGLVSGEAAQHQVAGVEALGYRGDAAALASAVGTGLGAAVVDVFNLWVAADGGWVVELDLSITGPGADLAPLLGPLPLPAGQATLVSRHRLDLGAAADPIKPPD